MMYLILIGCILFIRIFSGYDSRYQKGKYISIKNPILRVILLDSLSLEGSSKRRKKDRNKMSVSGLIYYIAAAVVLIINIVLLIVPKIPIEPWIIETSRFIMYTDTLNEKISAVSIWLLFLSVCGYMILRCIRFSKTIEQKWLRIFVYAVLVFAFCAVGCVCVYIVKEFVICFL